MRIACFNIRMKVVLNVKVSCTVGVGADQDPVESKKNKGRYKSSSTVTPMREHNPLKLLFLGFFIICIFRNHAGTLTSTIQQ